MKLSETPEETKLRIKEAQSEIYRVSSRQEAAEYSCASPSPSFFLYPTASSLILWGFRAVGFVQKNGVGNPLEGPSQFSRIDGSSPLSEGANARKNYMPLRRSINLNGM